MTEKWWYKSEGGILLDPAYLWPPDHRAFYENLKEEIAINMAVDPVDRVVVTDWENEIAKVISDVAYRKGYLSENDEGRLPKDPMRVALRAVELAREVYGADPDSLPTLEQVGALVDTAWVTTPELEQVKDAELGAVVAKPELKGAYLAWQQNRRLVTDGNEETFVEVNRKEKEIRWAGDEKVWVPGQDQPRLGEPPRIFTEQELREGLARAERFISNAATRGVPRIVPPGGET